MKRIVLLFLVCLVAGSAQPQARRVANHRKASSARPSSALVDPNDLVLPDLAAGGGWESILTFVNMSGGPARFNLTFYDGSGNARNMPILNSDGSFSRTASVDFTLDPNTSTELVLPNVDNGLNSAWGYITPSADTQGLGGLAVVRTKDGNGQVISESTEALSNIQDYDFFATFDNIGVSTTLVLVNPASTRTTNVKISAQDSTGTEIVYDTVQIPAGGRVLISLPDAYPALGGIVGKLRVTADTQKLSAICFRTNPSGGIAYSPIFNWSGLFNR